VVSKLLAEHSQDIKALKMTLGVVEDQLAKHGEILSMTVTADQIEELFKRFLPPAV
jgi:hypothetical protein